MNTMKLLKTPEVHFMSFIVRTQYNMEDYNNICIQYRKSLPMS